MLFRSTMLGAKEIFCPSIKAKVERDYLGTISGRTYLLAQLNEDTKSVLIFNEQEDFVNLAAANALVSITDVNKIKAGDSVTTVILPNLK